MTLNLSKWALSTLSMPLGKEGKIPRGLFIPLLKCNQKQRGQSFRRLKDDGENLYAMEKGTDFKVINFTNKYPVTIDFFQKIKIKQGLILLYEHYNQTKDIGLA